MLVGVRDHHHKHQGLDPLIRSGSTVTTALSNISSVFQLFSFLAVCSGMISKGFVALFASVEASSVCIHLSCLVCLYIVVVVLCVLLSYVYLLYYMYIAVFLLQMPDCWLEVSIRKVLRPAISTQFTLGFPVPISKC